MRKPPRIAFNQWCHLAACWTIAAQAASADTNEVHRWIDQFGIRQGICAVVGSPGPDQLLSLTRHTDLVVYVESATDEHVLTLQQAAEAAGLLGTRIYVEKGSSGSIHLASNLADAILVMTGADAQRNLSQDEILRVIHPGAAAVIDGKRVTKAWPAGLDDWSHPYHGPDNNPQSTDAFAQGSLLTQFLAEPWYVPMPQVTVASGGRVFKAFGHIALKEREWPWLNSLVAINGYNGTLLWKRSLKPGFMIHRNTLVATPDALYMGDDSSCKVLDPSTGQVVDEITVPAHVDEAGVWKWMAVEGDILYALVGEHEVIDTVIRGSRNKPGWPWSGLGEAYAGKYPWGFGRTLLAIDLATQQIKWTYKSTDPIDSRAMCMAASRIYVYCHLTSLACVDAATGSEVWRTVEGDVLDAIGAHDRAQHPAKGFASSSFAKANANAVYFAGPQRRQLVAVSAEDGSLMWQYPHGNFQLVLRPDGLYAMGRTETSKKFDYRTGQVLQDLACYRGNCTRATASMDSIFTRGYRHTGTMRWDTSTDQPQRMALMRPACQDGVIVSNGHMFWGPWMCDCNHSLVGLIGMAPAGDFEFERQARESERLEGTSGDPVAFEEPPAPYAWPGYRNGTTRESGCDASVAAPAHPVWEFPAGTTETATAPVIGTGTVFWSGLHGVIYAADMETSALRWTAYTGGAVRFPPELWRGHVYVGSADGWVYCLTADTGRRVWRFRAAPAERKISVHGRLSSTWPVGSGVLLKDGIAYAAAGIASYDGTHVYALDAQTGRIVWQNNTSGSLDHTGQVTGVSVQGHLLMHDGRLYLAGGNVVSPAIYDAKSGNCLNGFDNEWLFNPQPGEAFPSKPRDEMFRRTPRGRELFLVNGDVRVFDQLLYSPPHYIRAGYLGGHFLQASRDETIVRATAGRVVRLTSAEGGDDSPQGLWEYGEMADPRALVVADDAVLVAGETSHKRFVLTALGKHDGQVRWTHKLPAAPVSWGMAVDHQGRIAVTLVDGRVVCLASGE